MTEDRTPYAATETALPSECIAETPQDRPQTWTPQRHRYAAELVRLSRDAPVLSANSTRAAFAYLSLALPEIERLTAECVRLAGLVDVGRHTLAFYADLESYHPRFVGAEGRWTSDIGEDGGERARQALESAS